VRGHEDLRTRGPEIEAVQRGKGETRGHVGMVTRGHGERHRFGWQVAAAGGRWRAEVGT